MRIFLFLVVLVFLCFPISGATLTGTIYNLELEMETNVILEVDTTPIQKFLSKDGDYSFTLPPGQYTLTAQKGEFYVTEKLTVEDEGEFVFDVFLLGDLTEEEELLKETEVQLLDQSVDSGIPWRYYLAGAIVLALFIRFFWYRRKYGSLWKFRKRVKADSKKTVQDHQKELNEQPDLIEKALDIIKKHDGRISQKDLRKEMLYLSEAKVSLIVTELEHKGMVEKVKKGRGNVLIVKGQ
jgi:uncharacterized membrane protein